MSLLDVNKITSEKVKEAALHLKQNKSDPLYDFNSDCLKNAPFIFLKRDSEVFCCTMDMTKAL